MIEAEPSLTIHGEALKIAFPFLACLLGLTGLVGVVVWIVSMMVLDGATAPLFWALLVSNPLLCFSLALYAAGCFGLGSAVYSMAHQMLGKPTIHLTPAGFRVTEGSQSWFTRWDDVEAFEIARDFSSHRDFIGWRFKPGAAPQLKWWQTKHDHNLDGSLGMGWAGSIEVLLATLEDWRVTYS